jgi:hypothetical protein
MSNLHPTDIGIKIWPVTKEIRTEFLRVKDWLAEGVFLGNVDDFLQSLWKSLLENKCVLITSHNAAGIFREMNTPKGKVLNIPLAGGDMDELRQMERYVEHRARENGFVLMSINGRRGWLRALDGYKEVSVYMEKNLNEAEGQFD